MRSTFVDGRFEFGDEVTDSPSEVLELGVVEVSAEIAGNYEMMNRIVDATGVPIPPSMSEVFAELGPAPFTDPR